MTTPATSTTAFAQSVRILSGALMGALVMMGLVLFLVLGTDATPPLWVPIAQLVAGVAVHLLVEAIGYRPAPLAPSMSDNEADAAARTAWQSAQMMRFALIEAIAIGSFVLAFVIDGGVVTYVGGALVSLALMAVHVWPGSRPVGKTAAALEAQGRKTTLREAFGQSSPGPIQQF